MIGAVRLRSLAGDDVWRVVCGMALVLALVRLQRAERLCAAAAAQGRRRAAAQAGRDALSDGDRQYGGRQRHHAGGARVGLHPGNRLQGRRRGQGRYAAVRHRARALPAGARAGAVVGSRRPTRRRSSRRPTTSAPQTLVNKGCRHPAGSRRGRGPARRRRRQAEAGRGRRQAGPAQPQLYRGQGAVRRQSSRRARCRWASWSAAATSTLATIVQLNPIYVNFNVSEKDVLRIRADMAKARHDRRRI